MILVTTLLSILGKKEYMLLVDGIVILMIRGYLIVKSGEFTTPTEIIVPR
jgi:hypothetical protein